MKKRLTRTISIGSCPEGSPSGKLSPDSSSPCGGASVA